MSHAILEALVSINFCLSLTQCAIRGTFLLFSLSVYHISALSTWKHIEIANVASEMRLFAAQPFLALRLFMAPLEKIK